MVAPGPRMETLQSKMPETTTAQAQPPKPATERAQSNSSTVAWVAMLMLMTLAAFAVGSTCTPEGWTA
eukprot:457234-Pleurochrysis_carterae.AAC.1